MRGGEDRDEARRRLSADASTIDYAWGLAEAWSVTSGAIKKTLVRARAATLLLLVGGATAGAFSASTGTEQLAVVAALALAFAGMLETFVITPARSRDWTASRMASERLKAAVWLCRTGVGPYAVAADLRPDILAHAIDEIETQAALEVARAMDPVPQPLPGAETTSLPDLYRIERAEDQRKYHRKAGGIEERSGDRLRIAVMVFSATGAVLVSLSSVDWFVGGGSLAAIVAALSAATAAITTYSSSARHHEIAVAYANTANRIELATHRFQKKDDSEAALPDYVAEVEQILAKQNDTWTGTIER